MMQIKRVCVKGVPVHPGLCCMLNLTVMCQWPEQTRPGTFLTLCPGQLRSLS